MSESNSNIQQKSKKNIVDENTKKQLNIIAHIRTDFPTKFGVPRQSGLIEELKAQIIFEPEYRNPDAFRGLEGFSRIWLLWEFSKAIRDTWAPMVKPPRLGGNKRMGVFATRSPFRPNSIGLSSVKLEHIEYHSELGPVLHVAGADMMDNTPIYDIKPYIPYTDSHPDAVGGFADPLRSYSLDVVFPEEMLHMIPEEKRKAIQFVLASDPRPSYQKDPNRRYGVEFAGFDVRFTVQQNTLTVCEVVKL
ncbi:tRNA (N6-threonylcarbamoyladenosine(37)-N6)-methyltransferase TrmO [Lachnospiraceae bacterium MD1]|uniref:tRNA (N6-threonylcarbamoyladenosine(37)-N6)-methyltransferase TrmO n=1 Tax=Variimorphobacter saccharofermentans TaxID=2755051 RepID=A0A839K139_9FIRM|nr:tRNA (N6-threonylcarbamoyladenosine(37)-N6)-methyltransferase TrmO [Variimorphobacter saccharofermentans]MBB2183360.1 tRNA (N6-threonylcarbamoyladenosine(37)-N6)-methyltransferase TrmO [Variimorphobacter saccharofermentans]